MILDDLAIATKKRIEKQKEEERADALFEEVQTLLASGYQNPAEKRLGAFPFEKALGGRANLETELENPGDADKKHFAIISEVKKASPSKGTIAEEFPYLAIAKEYEAAGADAISCLTEPDYFKGSDQYLMEIAKEVAIPVLRKDFTVDPYMIYQARKFGASAVLLIAAILTDEELKEYFRIAESLGLSCLFEAHDAEEVERCLAAGARILGVNNRNLKDFTVDINNSVRLREMVPADIIFVSESGISKSSDVKTLKSNGTNAVLIGEMLMRSNEKSKLIAELKEA